MSTVQQQMTMDTARGGKLATGSSGATTALAALRHSESLLRAALDAVPTFLAVLDGGGTILTVNAAWRAVGTTTGFIGAGRGRDQPLIDPEGVQKEVPPESIALMEAGIASVVGGRPRVEFSYPVATAAGERWFSARLASFGVGPDAWLLLSQHEITDLKRAATLVEEQLERQDRFLSQVSHDFRTPLSTIYQFATILRDGISGALNEEQSEHVETVLSSVEQLRRMVEDLLDAARLHNGKMAIEPRSVAIDQVVAKAVREWRHEAERKDVTLRLESLREPLSAWGDAERIRQVLDNLLGNALKFTPEGGNVQVRVAPHATDSERIEIEVTDDGCGMSPEECGAVFEPLRQGVVSEALQGKGLGLGLHICREILNEHGGTIWVESAPGEGSTFHFTLPRRSPLEYLTTALESWDPEDFPPRLLSVRLTGLRGSSCVSALSRSVAAILSDTLDPSTELSIPQPARDGAEVGFHVIARRGSSRPEELARRIQQGLVLSGRLPFGLDVRVAPEILEDAEPHRDGAVGELARSFVERLQETQTQDRTRRSRQWKRRRS